jgi:hypothetical protein
MEGEAVSVGGQVVGDVLAQARAASAGDEGDGSVARLIGIHSGLLVCATSAGRALMVPVGPA